MERFWITGGFAVSVTLVDFLDPALVGGVDVRERGVRLEVRPVAESLHGSVYASPSTSVRPAVLRVDLLESGPGAADRMHWHPMMSDGEPGDRVLDPAIGRDPLGWTRHLLTHLHDRVGSEAGDGFAVAAGAIAEEVGRLLDVAREPWPSVTHDERGLATSV